MRFEDKKLPSWKIAHKQNINMTKLSTELFLPKLSAEYCFSNVWIKYMIPLYGVTLLENCNGLYNYLSIKLHLAGR